MRVMLASIEPGPIVPVSLFCHNRTFDSMPGSGAGPTTTTHIFQHNRHGYSEPETLAHEYQCGTQLRPSFAAALRTPEPPILTQIHD